MYNDLKSRERAGHTLWVGRAVVEVHLSRAGEERAAIAVKKTIRICVRKKMLTSPSAPVLRSRLTSSFCLSKRDGLKDLNFCVNISKLG